MTFQVPPSIEITAERADGQRIWRPVRGYETVVWAREENRSGVSLARLRADLTPDENSDVETKIAPWTISCYAAADDHCRALADGDYGHLGPAAVQRHIDGICECLALAYSLSGFDENAIAALLR